MLSKCYLYFLCCDQTGACTPYTISSCICVYNQRHWRRFSFAQLWFWTGGKSAQWLLRLHGNTTKVVFLWFKIAWGLLWTWLTISKIKGTCSSLSMVGPALMSHLGMYWVCGDTALLQPLAVQWNRNKLFLLPCPNGVKLYLAVLEEDFEDASPKHYDLFQHECSASKVLCKTQCCSQPKGSISNDSEMWVVQSP